MATMRRTAIGERIGGGAWALAWMWPMIPAAVAVGQGKVHHAPLAGAGLLAFVVLYLVLVVGAFDDEHQTGRIDYLLLAAFTAVSLALVFAYGSTSDSWLNIVLYVSVCGVAVLRRPVAVAWVISSAAFLASYDLWLGHERTHGGFDANVLSDTFGLLLASALVFVVKQMIGYISVLQATRKQLARTAVVEERERFSRDLHDLLGHTLSLIVVKAEVIRRLADRDTEAVAREAAEIEEIGRQALAEVREAVTGYREPRFATELDRARAALTDAGITVRVQEAGGPLPEGVGAPLAWAIREAATNVIRHSRARTCTVMIHVKPDIARLEVVDDGVGSAGPAHRGTGLLGLQERLAAVGGTVSTSSGDGFQLVVSMPLTAVAA
jgi:two-component system, NarL family, sensor histidine kinase DesK